MKEEYGLDVTVQLDTPWQRLEPGLRVSLFQIVRELLFNVVKHAGVGAAAVSLAQAEEQVTVRVADDGVGFEPSQMRPTDGSGLEQARRRVELYGGRLRVDSRPGMGTTVTLTVPLAEGAPA
jgi:signal transduction histidine kinase